MSSPPSAPKTSDSHPLYVSIIDDSRPGRVGLTFAPGKRSDSAIDGGTWARDLDKDLDRLVSEYRAGLLVSLVEDHELTLLGIPRLVEEAARRMRVLRLPIVDGSVPTDAAAVRELVTQIARAADEGTNVVIHCRGGLGRAGLIGGCYLRHSGFTADEALERLRRRHPTKCPESAAQRDWIRRFGAGS
ncbi:MAG: dual specificity protein phosphatase family protein [Deltaproteobacteria bacterium]|nr:dual specificity protein phosphatase family protein [Deltaproteobacteria bacterium]